MEDITFVVGETAGKHHRLRHDGAVDHPRNRRAPVIAEEKDARTQGRGGGASDHVPEIITLPVEQPHDGFKPVGTDETMLRQEAQDDKGWRRCHRCGHDVAGGRHGAPFAGAFRNVAKYHPAIEERSEVGRHVAGQGPREATSDLHGKLGRHQPDVERKRAL